MEQKPVKSNVLLNLCSSKTLLPSLNSTPAQKDMHEVYFYASLLQLLVGKVLLLGRLL